ncbi:MAG TPA: hypothetical protein VK550_35740 [Polyangiaceae bacterium]|nr:hypothetical protein [Polyangiaceae bacterium]
MTKAHPLGEIPTEKPDVELFPILDRAWPADGLGPVSVIVAQLPDPADLRTGALVVVRESGPRPKGFRGWLASLKALFSKPPKAHAAVRCTALLARGYREISCAANRRNGEDVVWGTGVPTSRRSSSAQSEAAHPS